MSTTLGSPHRRRRPVRAVSAAVVSGALAFVGLGVSPAVGASTDIAVTASVTPTSVNAGAPTTFTVAVTGSTTSANNVASRIEVDVPAAFTGVNVVLNSFQQSQGLSGWSQTFIGPNTIAFVQSNASRGLQAGESLSVKVSATAAGTGPQTWTTRAYKGTASTSPAQPVGSFPVVTIVGNAPQTITFAPLGDKVWGAADFPVIASSTSSANPITFTASGNCTVSTSGDKVHLLQAGSCVITAHQAGGNGYTAADDVPQSFTIAKADQTITFPKLNDITYGDTAPVLGATATSGAAVIYAAEGNCTVIDNALVITGAGTCAVTATQTGNGNYNAASPLTRSFGIAKQTADVSLSELEATYDGQPHAPRVTTDPSGLDVDLTYSQGGSSIDSPVRAGTYTVVATISDANYTGSTSPAEFVIGKAPLTGHFTANDKAYDGTTDATVDQRSLTGIFGSDDVSLSGGTASFDTRDAGTGKTVELNGASLEGPDSGNYTLEAGPITTTADITARQIDATLTASDKTYDGGTVAGGDVSDLSAFLSGVLGSDQVSVVIEGASFDSRKVGSHTVTATVHLSGADSGNYALADNTITDTANIAAKILDGSFTALDKVYNGDDAATVATKNLSGVVTGDEVTLEVTNASFSDKDAGLGKAVSANLALEGADKENYVLGLTSASTTADITPASLTGSFTATNKIYDGTRTATVQPSLSGVIDGDTVTLTVADAMFGTKDVGTGKNVTGTLTLGGADAGNYVLSSDSTNSATADITAATVTGSFTADNKIYDGTPTATVHPSLTGVIEGDDVTLAVAGALFGTKDVGTGKTVTGGLSLTGADSDNYTLASTSASAHADITARTVDGTFTVPNKVYDGTTTATVTGRSLSPASGGTGKIADDDLQLTGGSGVFASAQVGTWNITGSGFGLGGADAGNYTLGAVLPDPTKASITPLYSGKGFYQPVDMSQPGGPIVYNPIKGGQTVPLKFNIFSTVTGASQTGLGVFGTTAADQAAAFSAKPINCASSADLADAITAVTTGGTSLRYDSTAGQYIQNWKTPTGAGNCYAVTVRTIDGSIVGPAYFKITK